MRKKENIGLLYIYGYFSVVVGNLLIDSHELITHHNHGENNVDHFTNIWYFYTTDDSNGTHEAIIQQGFSYAKPVDGLPNVYKVTSDVHPEVHVDPAHHMTDLLKQHDKVRWAVQGFTRNLYKRVPMDVRSRYERYFNDELWDLQWYEQDYRDNNDDDAPILDMNLVPVYEELKITGHNIRVAIVDDGLEYTHDDLKNNYAPEISINLNWNTKDPMPRYEDPSNTHGTRCAGEIAMAANNKICGVGVAYNSKVGGIVLLDGKTDDELEARALTYAYDLVDIYGGSWGPKDDGKTVDGPGVLGQMAFDKGATQGRDGKGSIYVFASGNGRTVFDNCAVDGYVGSIYTVAISSATIQGKAPAYAERCPGVMATAYSGGIDNQVKVVTTDVNNKCTLSHTGTSAAAPLAAGVIALALEANGNLTWRDVQHLLARNCEVTPLSTDPGWTTNAAGFYFNPQFGFGLLNAYRLVKESIDWQTVPKKSICSVEFDLTKTNRYFGRAAEFRSTVITDGCDNSVLYLEHVQLSITIQYPKRGAVEVDLISPQNTVCKMLEPRRWDESSEGFVGWKIKSLQFWGENPVGQWTAIVRDRTSGLYAGFTGSVENLKLILHGTQIPPYDN